MLKLHEFLTKAMPNLSQQEDIWKVNDAFLWLQIENSFTQDRLKNDDKDWLNFAEVEFVNLHRFQSTGK